LQWPCCFGMSLGEHYKFHMRTILCILGTLLLLPFPTIKAAAPSFLEEIRPVLSAPDQWHDMSDVLQKLALMEKGADQNIKPGIVMLRQKLNEYKNYFSERSLTLSSEDKSALFKIVLAYEKVFQDERQRLLKLWNDHPELLSDSPPTVLPQWREGDTELLKCFPIFSKHASNRSDAIGLASSYMEIMHGYGHLLDRIYIKSIEP
ncbi:MAG: hypothetical protein K8I00_03855, partial [Candidatus Omnitrophica bacterium]|nr:hypothetical protein [Candidatus Omnitrophota bacterium]